MGHWVAQSVRRPTLDFGSGHDLQGHEIEPHIKLFAGHGACLRFSLPLPLPLPRSCSLSISLSLSQKKKKLKGMGIIKENYKDYFSALSLVTGLSQTGTTLKWQDAFNLSNQIITPISPSHLLLTGQRLPLTQPNQNLEGKGAQGGSR